MKYWFFITTFYCPQCNRTTVYKERRSFPKPERWEDRHEDFEVYDGCDW